jgi:hypothetical protein
MGTILFAGYFLVSCSALNLEKPTKPDLLELVNRPGLVEKCRSSCE